MTTNTCISCYDLGMSEPPYVLVLDTDKVLRSLWVHATQASLSYGATIQWERFDNAVVQFLLSGTAGTWDVDLSSHTEYKANRELIFKSSVKKLKKLSTDANASDVMSFLERKHIETQECRVDLQQKFARVANLNQGELDRAVAVTDALFATKVMADVVFAGAAALSGVGFIAAVGAGMSYNLSSKFAISGHELSKTGIIAFWDSPQADKTLASQGAGTVVKTATPVAAKVASNIVQNTLKDARMALAAESAARQAYQNLMQAGESFAPRMLKDAKVFNAPLSNTRYLSDAAKHSAAGKVSAIGKAGGFITAIWFMKDDIYKAMNGYSASLEK